MAALSGIQILKYLTFKQKSGLMRLNPYKLKKKKQIQKPLPFFSLFYTCLFGIKLNGINLHLNLNNKVDITSQQVKVI